MIQAPSFYVGMGSYTADTLFSNITAWFQKGYVVGSGTSQNTQEVGGHAYAVLGAYTVTLDNGTKVNLIRYFNPWHAEVWVSNPWADNSTLWTPSVRSQVPSFTVANDGITYSTPADFKANFGNIVWGEVRDDYDLSFIDLPLTNIYDSLPHTFTFNLTYYGAAGNDLYVFIDQSDGYIWNGCNTPISAASMQLIASNGTVYSPVYSNVPTVKISNAANGVYTVKVNIAKNQNWARYFTVSSYSQVGAVNFIPPASSAASAFNAECPNSCNLQGRCNTATGVCSCYYGVISFYLTFKINDYFKVHWS